jgi:hypothetical protein
MRLPTAARPAPQVKYFTTLPDSLAGVRKVAAGMPPRAVDDRVQEAAEEESAALSRERHVESPAGVAAI